MSVFFCAPGQMRYTEKDISIKDWSFAMKQNKYDSLFNPSSIAIVGASNKKGKVGTVITENICKLGYKGRTYFVNPSYKVLKLKKCFATLGEIGKPVDCAIVAVPAKFVAEVVRDGAKNVKNFVVISAGFSETGHEGKEREEELAKLAERYGVNILGPNCLGFINPGLSLNASFAGGMPKAGNIAFISQSGALAVALMDKANEEKIGFSQVISIGNKMRVDESELLEFLGADKKTAVIGMYLEGIKQGDRFMEVASRVGKIKPVVILKAGKTEKSQVAISSHTGALAGSDDIVEAAFARAGVIRAGNLGEFFDLLSLISFTPVPKNEKVAVMTNAGGAGVLITDAFKNKTITLCDFSQKVKTELRKNIPAEGSVENPIDLLGDAQEDRYAQTFSVLKKQNIGSVITILTPQQQTPVAKIAEIVAKQKTAGGTSLLAVFIGGDRVKKEVSYLKSQGIVNFQDPDAAIAALDAYCSWNRQRSQRSAMSAVKENASRKAYITKVIKKAASGGRKALYFSEAAGVMAKYGIRPVESYDLFVGEKLPENISFPAVLKVDSDRVLHKSDKEAIILGIQDIQGLREAEKRLRNNFPTERFVAQKMGQKATEIILGIKNDPLFGPVIVYGLGGIYTEIFNRVDFLLLPASREQIKKELMQSKLQFLFLGARGQKPYDAGAFADVLLGLSEFARESDGIISEFDINPLFLYNDGKPAVAVDIKILL